MSLGLALLGHNVQWQEHAACTGSDCTFVPNHETTAGRDAVAAAYCNACPVRTRCLEWAMEQRAEGYWGGTDTDQRKKLRRVRTRAKCPLCQCLALVYTDQHELCLACGASWIRDVRKIPVAATPVPGAA